MTFDGTSLNYIFRGRVVSSLPKIKRLLLMNQSKVFYNAKKSAAKKSAEPKRKDAISAFFPAFVSLGA